MYRDTKIAGALLFVGLSMFLFALGVYLFFDHFMEYSDELKPYLNKNDKDISHTVRLGQNRNATRSDLSDRIERGILLEDGFYQPGDLIRMRFNTETLGGNYVLRCQKISVTRGESLDRQFLYDQLTLDPQVFEFTGEIAVYFSDLQFFHIGKLTFALPKNDDLWGEMIVFSINCNMRYPVMWQREYEHLTLEKRVRIKLLPESLKLQKKWEVFSREAVKITSVSFWFIAVFLMAIIKDIHARS